MAIRYVDSAASGANNGTSWTNAWTAISSATGANVSAGDTVYISGGTSGGAGKTYNNFAPKSGSGGTAITYQIGQDAGHNGIVTFARTSGSQTWISNPRDLYLTGDAGDGIKHFVMSGYDQHVFADTTAQNLKFLYIEFGDTPGGNFGRAMDFRLGTLIEIANCHIKGTGTSSDDDIVWLCSGDGGSSYGSSFHIHHNELEVPRGSGGGPDGLRFHGNGNTIHHNYFHTYSNGTSSLEHQDGMQCWTGDHTNIKIYCNRIVDFLNASILVSAYYGSYTDVYIFNNIIGFTASSPETTNQGGGVGLAGSDSPGLPFSMLRCVVANNIIIGGSQSYWLNNSANVSATWTNCQLVNNVTVQADDVDPDTSHGVVALTNVSNMSAGTAVTSFVSYGGVTAYATNDVHLLSGASSLRGQGTNLTSLGISEMLTDFDGVTRPAVGAWDIGPFQFEEEPPPSSNNIEYSGTATFSSLSIG